MAGSAFLKIPWKEGLFFKRDSKFDQLFHVSSHQAHNQVKKKEFRKQIKYLCIYLIFCKLIYVGSQIGNSNYIFAQQRKIQNFE